MAPISALPQTALNLLISNEITFIYCIFGFYVKFQADFVHNFLYLELNVFEIFFCQESCLQIVEQKLFFLYANFILSILSVFLVEKGPLLQILYEVLPFFYTGWLKSDTKNWIQKCTKDRFFRMANTILKFLGNSASKIKVSLYEDVKCENRQFTKYLHFHIFLQ